MTAIEVIQLRNQLEKLYLRLHEPPGWPTSHDMVDARNRAGSQIQAAMRDLKNLAKELAYDSLKENVGDLGVSL